MLVSPDTYRATLAVRRAFEDYKATSDGPGAVKSTAFTRAQKHLERSSERLRELCARDGLEATVLVNAARAGELETEPEGPTYPVKVAAVFAEHPEATMVAEEWGHAYGLAKYNGRCKLTGASITKGLTYLRHVVIWHRDGTRFEGHVSNEALGWLRFVGGEAYWSSWTLWNRDDKSEILAAVEAATKADTAGLDIREGRDNLTRYGWNAKRGKWQGRRWSQLSTKQLLATLRRKKHAIAWQLRIARDDD